jgi:hypothetical protein
MEQVVRSAYVDIVDRQTMGENLYRVTIAANEKARQSPELDFGGLSTENYSRNPVVMWAHDMVGRSPSGGLPIGRTLNLSRPADGTVVAEFEFLGDDLFAARVRNAWDRGFLQAASIFWLPVESAPGQDGGWRDTRSELLEWSLVAVPADPDALKESHRRMVAQWALGSDELAVMPGPLEGEGDVELRELAEVREAVVSLGAVLARVMDGG